MTVPLGEPIFRDGTASWDDRAAGGGLESTWLKLNLPSFVSGTYANEIGNAYVELGFNHLDFGDPLMQGVFVSQSCDIVVNRTSTGGISGSLDCTGVNQSAGPYHAKGTFAAEP